MKAKASKTSSVTGRPPKQPFFSKGSNGVFSPEFNSTHSPFFIDGSHQQNFFNRVGIQPKLTIGQPHDQYELEADTMANKVVQRRSEHGFNQKNVKESSIQTKLFSPLHPANTSVQTKCASCEEEERLQKKEEDEGDLPENNKLQKKPIFEGEAKPSEDEKNIQTKCDECAKEDKNKVQKKSVLGSGESSPSSLATNLSSSKGSGVPLPMSTREHMESSFGADFSNVRIHAGSDAMQMNRDLNAQAFTHGSDVYFNSGKYDTGTKQGQHLLAHELTHVVQQGNSDPAVIHRRPKEETE